MASIKQLDERRYKITVSNGYRPNGKKISKAKTIQVPVSYTHLVTPFPFYGKQNSHLVL